MVEAKKKKSYWFGVFAEYYVICLFAIFGYRFLTRRYKTKLGEIDLIFRKGNAVVAVEVKARSDYKTEVGEVKCLIPRHPAGKQQTLPPLLRIQLLHRAARGRPREGK